MTSSSPNWDTWVWRVDYLGNSHTARELWLVALCPEGIPQGSVLEREQCFLRPLSMTPSASLQMTQSWGVQLTQQKDGIPSRGTWTTWEIIPYLPHEVQQAQVQGAAPVSGQSQNEHRLGDGYGVGAPLLWTQAEKSGVAHPREEKAPEKPHCRLPALEGAYRKEKKQLFKWATSNRMRMEWFWINYEALQSGCNVSDQWNWKEIKFYRRDPWTMFASDCTKHSLDTQRCLSMRAKCLPTLKSKQNKPTADCKRFFISTNTKWITDNGRGNLWGRRGLIIGGPGTLGEKATQAEAEI